MEERRRRRRRIHWDSFLAGILVGGICFSTLPLAFNLGRLLLANHRQQQKLEEITPEDSDLLTPLQKTMNKELEEKMGEINRIVDNNFIFDVDAQLMMDNAVKGYMSGLQDPYSVYYTKEEYQETMEDSDGSYVGIGVAVQQNPETLTIVVTNVYEDSPADKGGMLINDIILAVDGRDVTSMELDKTVDLIRGDADTQVVLTVLRDGETLDLTMIRGSVDKMTVEYKMLTDQIGYLALSEFDKVSVKQMENALTKLKEEGMTSLILDLRNNGGGLLSSVIDIADFFLEPGTNIFYSENKAGEKKMYDAEDEVIYQGDMAILVNGNTASASEVLSGSLKDHGLATIVGEQSFGKGIVQGFYELSDGSAIKLTVSHYFTPDGNDIHGVGIAPHIVVEDDRQTEEDEQLQAALEVLE